MCIALEGEWAMKKSLLFTLVACFIMVSLYAGMVQAQEPKITVFNPLGQPPAIARVPMAPRIDQS